MITREELMKLATAVAEAELRIKVWQTQGQPIKSEDLIKSRAEIIIAEEALDKARSEFERELRTLSSKDIDKIMGEDK